MNLFLECLDCFSGIGLDTLVNEIGPNMPEHFLLSTLQLQRPLESHRSEIEAIAAQISVRNGEREAWRNPEVYGQIALLANRARSSGDLLTTIESLRLQAGMIQPQDARLSDGVYRLAHVDGRFYSVENGKLRAIQDTISIAIPRFRGLVFLPFPNLFADLVSPSLYTSTNGNCDRAKCGSKLDEAFKLLANYSSDLVSDLLNVVRTIVLVPDNGDAQRWSYNLRLAYFGGVFINPFVVGAHGMVEGLIHEYCHQRLWQWWAYEAPAGLPSEDQVTKSPVTGRIKSTRVMLHALLIYVSVHHYYLNTIDSIRLEDSEREWIAGRVALMSEAIPQLYQELCSQIQRPSDVSRLLDYVMEKFTTPV